MEKSFVKFAQKFVGVVFASILLALSLMLSSCGEDSGLGATIDAKAPKLEITYPAESGIAIRDSFILYGTCSDDKSVARVAVSVKSLEKSEGEIGYADDSFLAEVSSDSTTWSITLNDYDADNPDYFNGWRYADGKYEVSATCYDNAGNNSGTYSKTFEIDNTPPVFIISNPGVVKSKNLSPSAYGSIFTIDGTISDNHTISTMDVAIYDESGSLVSHETYDSEQIDCFREEEISTAGGTSVTIAQYAETSTTTANTRYSDIYGSDSSAGTKYYYASVTLSDSAQVYQNPTGRSSRSAEEIKADERGNETSKLYLYDDVYSSLMSTKKGLGLNASNLKDIISGITVNEDALDKLNENVIDTASAGESDALANKLSFSLNPEANPVYNVNGFEFAFSDNDALQTASSGNMVSVTITAGLDNTNIAPEVVRVWMKEYSEKPSESDEDKIKADLLALEKDVESLEDSETDFIDTIHAESGSATSVSTNNNENDWILIYDYSLNNSKGSSVSTKTFSVTLPEGISLTKYYILGVTGYDIEEVEFSQNTVYGFEGNTAGVAPTLTIDSPDSLAIFGEFDSSSVFTGKATLSTNQLYISEISATLSITDESSSSQASVAKYTDSIKWINDWDDSTYGAISWDETSSTWKFDASKIQELVDLYNSKKDDGIYWLCTLTVEAKSSSGHSGEISRSIHIDTVAPTVTINSVTPNVSGAEYFSESDTNTYLNGKITFKGTIEEQNLDSVSFDILAGGESVIEELGISGELGKVYSVSKEIDTSIITEKFATSSDSDPKIEVEIRLTAVDKAGNSATYSSKSLLGGEQNYVVYQETDRPKITFGNADTTITSADDVNVDTNLFGTTSNNKLSISFEDDDAISKYEVYLYKEDGTTLATVNDVYGVNPYSATPKKTTASLNYLLPETEGVYQVKVVAYDSEYVGGEVTAITDAFRKIEIGNFFIAVDSGAPTLSVDSVSAYVSTTDSIMGTVSPSTKSFDNGTSISAVFLDSELQKLETQPATLSADASGTSWTFPLSALPSNASQNYILKITAKDKYQQESSTNVTFKMDPIAPTITEPASEQTVKLDESSYVTLNAVVSDDTDGSGLSTVGYYLSDVNTAPSSYESVSWTAMNQTNDDWRTTFDISSVKNEDGILYAFFGAKDNAGNTKVSASSIKLTIDKTAPAITVTGFDGNAVSANGSTKTKDSTKTFSVEVTDTNLDSLVSDNSSVTVGPVSVSGDVTTYPITVSWSSTDDKIEDSQTVTFTATDENGRTATYTVTLACDNSAPVVTLDDYDEYASSSVELTGTVSDTNFTKTSSNFKVYLLPADSAKTTKSGIVTFGDSDTSWSATFTGLEETSYDIVVVAKDSFGNSSAYRTGSVSVPDDAGFKGEALAFTGSAFNVDVNAPELTENSVTIGTSSENASQTENFYYNGGSDSIYISGQATDFASGIASVVILPYSKTATDEITATYDSTSGTFTATIENSKITKSGTIYAKITDKAGNSNEVNLVAITYDATAPVIQSATLADSSAYTAYKPKQNEDVYYVNNTSGNFTLSGIATDNLGLGAVGLSIKDNNGATITPTLTDQTNLSEWNFNIGDNLKNLTGPLTATLTVTDKAKNSVSKDITIKFDTTSPAALHEFDSGATPKDVVFRLGDSDNDLSELKTWQPSHTSLTAADKDVGGKYAAGTYGKANTIEVRGYFTEEGSGLQYIYYKVFSGSTAPTAEEIADFTSDYENQKTSVLSAITEETKNVKYNTSSTDYEFREVKTNFKSTISEFSEGKNYLVLVGVDYVGNAAVDGISFTPAGSSDPLNCYAINVDVKAPTVERVLADGESSTLLTNASASDINLSGTAIDNPSENAAGIKSVVASITVGGTEYASSDSDMLSVATSDSNTKWTVTVKKELFSSVDSGNFSVYVTATDNAGSGNSQTSNVGTISVDKVKPTVTLTAPSDADTSTTEREINGNIDLSGTIKDANPLPSTAILAIQYMKKSDYSSSNDNTDDGWTTLTNAEKGQMSELVLSGDYTFDIKNFDTTKIDPLNDVAYYLRAKATDQAGNIGYSSNVEVLVSQNSDRPVIKITNLTDLGESASPRFVLKYGTKSQVIATVTDDDGIESASDVVISEEKYTGSGSLPANSVYSTTNGTVTFTPSADNTAGKNVDGQKKFYIYVKDAAGKVFYTTYNDDNSALNYLNVPKVKINDTALTDEADAAVFTYQSDSTSPTVEYIQALAYKTDGTTANGALNEDTGEYSEYENVSASYVLGGSEKQKAKFFVTASDASGIDGIALEIAYTELDGSTETAKTLLLRSKDDSAIADENYTVSGTFTQDSNDATKASWTTDIIDFNKVKTGSVTVKVIPYDKLGLVGNGNATFAVDNSGPAIKISSPASGEECTGEVTVSGTAIDDGSAGTADIQWIVPTNTERTTAASKTTDAAKLAYLASLSWNGGSTSLSSKATVSAWIFDFDGNYDNATSTPASYIFKAGNPKLDVYDSGDFATNSDYATSGLYLLPVYFMATDNLGNRTVYESYTLSHNPDADKPKIEFTYPTTGDYDSEDDKYVTLGGTIRVTGSAVIPSGTTTVDSVYVQVANSSSSFTGTAEATTEETDSYIDKNTYGLSIVSAYNVLESVLGSSVTVSSDSDAKKYGFASKAAMDAWWGIKTNGKASWNIALNSDGKMDPDDNSGTTNDITIRACGVNAEGKFGAWTTGDDVIAIHIDNAAPTMTAVVNQYGTTLTSSDIVSSNAAIEASSSQTYESDMYLRGQWYLVLDILDETGVSSLTVKESNSVLAEGTDYFVATINDGESGITDSSTNKKGRKVFIPISSPSSSVSYTVTAVDADATGHSQTTTFSFNIDNDAPSMENITANGSSVDSADFTSIEDSNYQFIISGSSTDEGSGVEHVLFYFMRKNGTTGTIKTNVVMDPVITSGTEDSKIPMTSLTECTFTQESETFTLYAKAYSGSATTETFTSDSAYDAHVRVGGLVEIDGILHTISDISGNTVTFSPSLTAAKTSFTAYFPIAQVIDNSATEKVASYSANPFTFEKGDDGDSMPESFSKSGKTWTWDATIHSTNIPDGPVSLVILAFDNAGNVAGKTINTTITNNAPRLAKVFLATDLNNNNKFEDDEFESYNIIGKEGKEQETYELSFADFGSTYASTSSGTFTAKNKLAVVPEIVGGNGNLSLVAKKDATTTDAVTTANGTAISSIADKTSDGTDATALDATDASSYTITASKFAAASSGNKFYAYVLSNAVLAGKETPTESDDGTDKAFSFTFWDSTEERTQGTDSQNTVLLVNDFTFDLVDGTAPKTVINPFYWNGINENSIYDSGSASSSTDLKGHIEFEDDLTTEITETLGYGEDPKVSGIVTFTGTAYDEHSLSEIDFTFGSYMSGTIATYDSAASSWTAGSETLDTDGWQVTVSYETATSIGYYNDSAYFGQAGHKVYWTLSIDTEKISDVAKLDVVLSVTAKDLTGNVTSTATTDVSTRAESNGDHSVTDGTTNLPTYQMDVVPYVVGVKTSLSSLKKNRSSVYDRTALGHYPVASTETIYVYGFNLNDGTIVDEAGASATLTAVGDASSLKWYSSSAVPVAGVYSAGSVADFTSGSVYAKVGEIQSLNNFNENDAKDDYEKKTTNATGDYTIYANYPNRQPNDDSNNNLTDDVILDVWEITKDAVKPKAGAAANPVMSINPYNHDVGFAFVNGTLYYSMPHGNTYSYDYWIGGYDVWTSVGLTYDKYGNSYATAAGGDINAEKADQFRVMTSRWGRAKLNTDGYNDGTNQFRLELIGQRDFEGSGNSYTGYNNFDKERIQSPAMAATASSADKTTLYMAYYDAINDEIRFKWGYFTDAKRGDSESGLFGDYYGQNNFFDSGDGKGAGGNSEAGEKTLNTTYGVYRTVHNSLLAGQTERVVKTDGTTTSAIVLTEGNQPVYAGKYVSIAAIEDGGTNDDAVVAVWWDGTNNQLLYSYNKTPKSIEAGQYLQSDTKWNTPVTVFGENIGEYCKVVTDANGGVHIAAYDGSNGDVWYAYLDDFDKPANMKTCIVDSYGIIGTRLNIDVALNSNNTPIPYISYYSASRPKIARWSDAVNLTSSSVINGATDEQFTGYWEVSYVPTSSKFTDSNIGVGVWKDSNGVLNYSTTDGNAPGTANIGENTYQAGQAATSESYGKVWGNGTKNAILGYATTSGASGYIETAQMK